MSRPPSATSSTSLLLGIIAADTSPLDGHLLSAPPSLPGLSDAKPDGWGAALFDAERHWSVEAHPRCAIGETASAMGAPHLVGTVLVAHVPARSAAHSEPIQPFLRSGWVFAHSGMLASRHYLLANASSRRLEERGSDSDGELLFAYLLGRLDRTSIAAGANAHAAPSDLDGIVDGAVTELVDRRIGALSFLLSDGAVTYVHRFGSPLWLCERRERTPTVSIASEPLTNEPWCALDERTLLRCERHAGLVFVRGSDPRTPRKSDIELPFTD